MREKCIAYMIMPFIEGLFFENFYTKKLCEHKSLFFNHKRLFPNRDLVELERYLFEKEFKDRERKD